MSERQLDRSAAIPRAEGRPQADGEGPPGQPPAAAGDAAPPATTTAAAAANDGSALDSLAAAAGLLQEQRQEQRQRQLAEPMAAEAAEGRRGAKRVRSLSELQGLQPQQAAAAEQDVAQPAKVSRIDSSPALGGSRPQAELAAASADGRVPPQQQRQVLQQKPGARPLKEQRLHQAQQQQQHQQHQQQQHQQQQHQHTAQGAEEGADALQQTLHQRLQQLLLPELGRQAILQSLDPATQCMVECGIATGIFSVDTERIMCMCSGCSQGSGPPGPEFMPSEFERHGGMAACKKWRFSIKVADGGPGMTLGRWLDMRGIQISSYPAKGRHLPTRTKRPLEIGRGILSSGMASASSGHTIQLDVGQLLAGLTQNNQQLTAALRSAVAGGSQAAAQPGGSPAVATAGQSSGGGNASSGVQAAAGGGGGGGSRLSELAAAVADVLVKELPAATAMPGLMAAAASGSGSLTNAPAMSAANAAAHAAAANVAAANAAVVPDGQQQLQYLAMPDEAGGPGATNGTASTSLWPTTPGFALSTGPGPGADDVPAGYVAAAEVASGSAGGATGPGSGDHSGPFVNMLQHGSGPQATGGLTQQQLQQLQQLSCALLPSSSSVSKPRLQQPQQQDSLSHAVQHSLTSNSLHNSLQSAGPTVLQVPQRLGGQVPGSNMPPPAAAPPSPPEQQQQLLEGAAAAGGLGRLSSSDIAEAAAATAAAAFRAAAKASGVYTSSGLHPAAAAAAAAANRSQGAAVGRPSSYRPGTHQPSRSMSPQQQQVSLSMSLHSEHPSLEAPGQPSLDQQQQQRQHYQQLQQAMAAARASNGAFVVGGDGLGFGSSFRGSPPGPGLNTISTGSDWAMQQQAGRAADSGGGYHARQPPGGGRAVGVFVVGPHGGEQQLQLAVAPERLAGAAAAGTGSAGGGSSSSRPGSGNSSGGREAHTPTPAAAAAGVGGSGGIKGKVGAAGSADFHSLLAAHVGGSVSVRAAGAAAARPGPGAALWTAGQQAQQQQQAQQPAEWHRLVGSLESRLDLLLEDRRRKRQLEEEAAALRSRLSQLQAELATERQRRLAAEQQLSKLGSLLQQLDDDQAMPAAAAAAAADEAAAPGAPSAAAAVGSSRDCSGGGSLQQRAPQQLAPGQEEGVGEAGLVARDEQQRQAGQGSGAPGVGSADGGSGGPKAAAGTGDEMSDASQSQVAAAMRDEQAPEQQPADQAGSPKLVTRGPAAAAAAAASGDDGGGAAAAQGATAAAN